MAKFSYTAVDAKGKQATGTIDAADQNDAIAQIRQQGLYPQRLDEAKEAAVSASAAGKRRRKSGAARSRRRSSPSSPGSSRP